MKPAAMASRLRAAWHRVVQWVLAHKRASAAVAVGLVLSIVLLAALLGTVVHKRGKRPREEQPAPEETVPAERAGQRASQSFVRVNDALQASGARALIQ